VGGSEQQPIYIMHIEGHASEGIEALESALQLVRDEGIDAHMEPLDTMIS
jgi:glycine cleavage system transcriptional repressor